MQISRFPLILSAVICIKSIYQFSLCAFAWTRYHFENKKSSERMNWTIINRCHDIIMLECFNQTDSHVMNVSWWLDTTKYRSDTINLFNLLQLFLYFFDSSTLHLISNNLYLELSNICFGAFFIGTQDLVQADDDYGIE